MASSDGRSSRAWKALCSELRRELAPICWICGRDIDLTLDPRHRMSWTLDHVLPMHTHPELAMDRTNLRPAHRSCNSRKGKDGTVVVQHTQSSRVWC